VPADLAVWVGLSKESKSCLYSFRKILKVPTALCFLEMLVFINLVRMMSSFVNLYFFFPENL